MPKNIAASSGVSDGTFTNILVNVFAARVNSIPTSFVVYNSNPNDPLFKIDGKERTATFQCDLNVVGNASFTTVSNVAVTNSMMSLANDNNVADLIDIGFYGEYYDTETMYRGLIHSIALGRWILFKDITVTPSTTVTLSGAYHDDLEVSNLYFGGAGDSIVALRTDVDEFPNSLKDLTADEITQLTNIGSNSISSTQWGYLSSLNQSISTTDSPSFAGITLTSNSAQTAGTFNFPAGTVEAPSIYFGADSTTGFFRADSNQIGIAISGTNVGKWSSSGLSINSTGGYNLLLGTGSPLNGDLNGRSAGLFMYTITQPLENSANTDGIYLNHSFASNGGATIHTSAAGLKLFNVYSSLDGIIYNAYGIMVQTGSAIGSGGTILMNYGGYFSQPTAGNTKCALYADNLSVGYDGIAPPSSGATINGTLSLGTSDSAIYSTFKFYCNGTAYIDNVRVSDGHMTLAPGKNLYLRSTDLSHSILYDDGVFDGATVRGWVGVKLSRVSDDRTGSVQYDGDFWNSIVGDLGTSTNKWGTVYATTGTINTSDANEKKDIAESKLGLSFINRLRPVSYKLKENSNGRTHYGLIAQELKIVLDELKINSQDFAGYVDPSATGKLGSLGIRYDEFISPIIKSIQELTSRLVALEQKI